MPAIVLAAPTIIGASASAGSVIQSAESFFTTEVAPSALVAGVAVWAGSAGNALADDAQVMQIGFSTAIESSQGFETNALATPIPGGATIEGIEITIEKSANYFAGQNVVDATVQLIKAGTLAGDNKADAVTPWPVAAGVITYGGPADLWGTSWTAAQINAANFGLVLQGQRLTADLSSYNFDYTKIKVYYS